MGSSLVNEKTKHFVLPFIGGISFSQRRVFLLKAIRVFKQKRHLVLYLGDAEKSGYEDYPLMERLRSAAWYLMLAIFNRNPFITEEAS